MIMTSNRTTDFGFEQVTLEEKTKRVGEVFRSVASNYDLMNDLMSFGIHRMWKRYAVHMAHIKPGDHVLDVAGGTGDMSMLFNKKVGEDGLVIMSDINERMLSNGRNKLIDNGILKNIDYLQANAEVLPFLDCTFDCISIAFGLRNVTDKDKALSSMFDKLKYGGKVIILEFSKVILPALKPLYEQYSFRFIPALGGIISKDKESYQYLVESIRKHPDQDTLKSMMENVGFSEVSFNNLSGGIVAVHKGYKL